eukprot:gene21845-26294_t
MEENRRVVALLKAADAMSNNDKVGKQTEGEAKKAWDSREHEFNVVLQDINDMIVQCSMKRQMKLLGTLRRKLQGTVQAYFKRLRRRMTIRMASVLLDFTNDLKESNAIVVSVKNFRKYMVRVQMYWRERQRTYNDGGMGDDGVSRMGVWVMTAAHGAPGSKNNSQAPKEEHAAKGNQKKYRTDTIAQRLREQEERSKEVVRRKQQLYAERARKALLYLQWCKFEKRVRNGEEDDHLHSVAEERGKVAVDCAVLAGASPVEVCFPQLSLRLSPAHKLPNISPEAQGRAVTTRDQGYEELGTGAILRSSKFSVATSYEQAIPIRQLQTRHMEQAKSLHPNCVPRDIKMTIIAEKLEDWKKNLIMRTEEWQMERKAKQIALSHTFERSDETALSSPRVNELERKIQIFRSNPALLSELDERVEEDKRIQRELLLARYGDTQYVETNKQRLNAQEVFNTRMVMEEARLKIMSKGKAFKPPSPPRKPVMQSLLTPAELHDMHAELNRFKLTEKAEEFEKRAKASSKIKRKTLVRNATMAT